MNTRPAVLVQGREILSANFLVTYKPSDIMKFKYLSQPTWAESWTDFSKCIIAKSSVSQANYEVSSDDCASDGLNIFLEKGWAAEPSTEGSESEN